MKKNEVKVGMVLRAQVNGKLQDVKITAIRDHRDTRGKSSTAYHYVNLATGRDLLCRSASKFHPLPSEALRKSLAKAPEAEEKKEKADPTDKSVYGSRALREAPIESKGKPLAEVFEAEEKKAEPAPVEAPKAPASGLAARLGAPRKSSIPPHVIVKARAGTGKTTTLTEGLKLLRGLPVTITPSIQQRAVWDSLLLSKDASSVCFVAFNKSIAVELQKRMVESGLEARGCTAMTLHSMGYKAVLSAFGSLRSPNSWRVQDIIGELLEVDIRELKKAKPVLVNATEELVAICKQNLVDGSDEGELERLSSYYDVDLNGNRSEVFSLVPRVLERCKDVKRDGCCDFNDMIWLPLVLNLPIKPYDLLLVDEAQDLNRAQQLLAKKAGRRLLFCGDDRQSIYGFAGADCESLPRLFRELSASAQGCVELPLTVTRRCGKAIVKLAQELVPDFEAHESNCEGLVREARYPKGAGADYMSETRDGDMILCRVNAPLVSHCFRFLRQGRKAVIQGRDVGRGLVRTIEKVCRPLEPRQVSVPTLVQGVEKWLDEETRKENAKKNPSEGRLQGLQDRYECLLAFTEGQTDAEGVVKKIGLVFTDDKTVKGIMLSSVHKAKGLESERVYILLPKGASMPHPMAKSAWEKEQEYNIKYVAITRAIRELVWVVEGGSSESHGGVPAHRVLESLGLDRVPNR